MDREPNNLSLRVFLHSFSVKQRILTNIKNSTNKGPAIFLLKTTFGIQVGEEELLKLDLRQEDQLSDKEINWIKMLRSIRKSCGEVCDTTIKGKP